jgi:aspartate oxidase
MVCNVGLREKQNAGAFEQSFPEGQMQLLFRNLSFPSTGLQVIRFLARATLLAAGGAGHVYPNTTNPLVSVQLELWSGKKRSAHV